MKNFIKNTKILFAKIGLYLCKKTQSFLDSFKEDGLLNQKTKEELETEEIEYTSILISVIITFSGMFYMIFNCQKDWQLYYIFGTIFSFICVIIYTRLLTKIKNKILKNKLENIKGIKFPK